MKRIAALLALLVVAVLAAPGGVAFAEGPLSVDGTTGVVITPVVWTVLTGLLTPLLVGLVTKAAASARLKAVVGIIVAAVAALIERATLVDGSALITQGLVLDVALVYGPQLGSYLGIWKHLNIAQRTAPELGIG